MATKADGYLIPGDVVLGNCYKVYLNGKLFAITQTQAAAEIIVAGYQEGYYSPTGEPLHSAVRKAFIEGLVWQ